MKFKNTEKILKKLIVNTKNLSTVNTKNLSTLLKKTQ